MCGFFGYLSAEPFRDRANYENRFLEAQKILHHRGPDDKGVEYFNISSPEENSYSDGQEIHCRYGEQKNEKL